MGGGPCACRGSRRYHPPCSRGCSKTEHLSLSSTDPSGRGTSRGKSPSRPPGTEARTHPLQPCCERSLASRGWGHSQEHGRASDSDSDARREVHRRHAWPPGVWFQRRPQKARGKGPSLPAGVGARPGSHSTARPPQVAQEEAPGRERQLAPPSPLLNGSESTVFSQSLGLGLELRSRD